MATLTGTISNVKRKHEARHEVILDGQGDAHGLHSVVSPYCTASSPASPSVHRRLLVVLTFTRMMPDFHRVADKTKGFFERLTRRGRSRNGNQDRTRYQDAEAEQGSTPYIRDAGTRPSLPVAGDGATSVVHLDASGSEAVHAFHPSAQDGVNVAHKSLPPPPAAISAHPTFDPSDLPPVPSAQERLRGPLSTPTPSPPLLNTRPTSHALQTPDQNHRSHSSRSSLSPTPAQAPHTFYSAPSFFSNASGINVHQMNNISNVHNIGSSKTVFDYLEPHVSHGAAHNSGERFDAPACAPETRVAVQEDIVGWMREGDGDEDPKQIMWLSGPAGCGKTAIAGSVAETCRKEGLLAATFFISSFSGSADRHSKRCIVATLARHLAGHRALHGYKVQLLASIERQPDIFHKRLSEQAEHLLIEPFHAVQEQGDGPAWPKGIILDGLDEVLAEKRPDRTPEDLERAHEEDQLEILDVLLTLANDPVFPFRIFVASRPERVISEFFATTAKTMSLTLFLDAKYKPDVDIARFLWSKFASIRRRYRISNSSWPGQEAVNRMVEMSSGQFIIPATIVRHIEAGVPQRQLDDILQLKWEDTGRKNPFAIVDALYSCILRRSPEPLLAATWLRIRTAARHPIPVLCFQQLMEDVEGEFHHVLGPLSSLISIPATGDSEAPLTVYHKSLGEYLSSQHRSGELYLSESSVNAFIAARCVRVLKSKGPAVPVLHSSNDWGQFLDTFYTSTLVSTMYLDHRSYHIPSRHKSPPKVISLTFSEWLPALSEDSRAELATCDVAWWTCLCLAQSPYKTEYLGTAFIGGMYSGIHRYICRSSSSSTSATCHVACRHWRAGILAEAKALNWCVHGLEQASLRELQTASDAWFNNRFKGMEKQKDGSVLSCTICQPQVATKGVLGWKSRIMGK